MTKYKNPCKLICKYNEKDLCTGCYRTKEEIINWINYSEKEREEIYKKIIERGGNPYEKKRYD
ncbi:MAG: DUF1289 domain-containing protein [Bacteroidales bacterium]|nr:DUF1289 domain-containing protein [Bacteroidales bacterium]MBN2755924.1 DUF1289 domain-containing protein [Bacteroidales bacterium]